jgi:two-component system, LytTR family, sensor kinase
VPPDAIRSRGLFVSFLRLFAMAIAIVAVWTGAAIVLATQSYMSQDSRGQSADLAAEMFEVLVSTFVSALLTPFLLYAAEKAPVTGRNNIVVPVLKMLGPVLLFAAIHALFDAWSPTITMNEPLSEGEFFRIAAAIFHSHLFLGACVVSAANLVRAERENVARARRERQIERDLSRAQLQVLQAEMEPHFLFNTLNAAAALLATDPQRAATTVFTLAELLQSSHALGQRTSIPVSAEVVFLESYLSLQKVRFADRLTTRIIVDPAARNVPVPSLILQPLVENAILHGVIERPDGGSVTISIRRNGAALHMEVRDDGPGATPHELANGRGLGLANTRSRLECLFKNDFTLRFHREPGAFVAALTIPVLAAGE